jgi:hypothetical protein
VSDEDYARALEAAVKEYEALAQQRQEIDGRLADVAQTIGTLSRLCGLTPTVPWGLTDACRVVLRSAGLPMTPIEIRERLRAIGFDLSRYSSDLAAIHTVLKRLNESGELRFVAQGPGKRAYIWNRPPRAVMLGPDVAGVVRRIKEQRPGPGKKVPRE